MAEAGRRGGGGKGESNGSWGCGETLLGGRGRRGRNLAGGTWGKTGTNVQEEEEGSCQDGSQGRRVKL